MHKQHATRGRPNTSRSRFSAYSTAQHVGGFAAGLAIGAAALAAWRVKTAIELASHSEPFEIAPDSQGPHVLIVGDSTAVGAGASSPQASLAGLMADRVPGLHIANRAHNGARMRDVVRQLEHGDGAKDRFDLILIFGGGNDVMRLTGKQQLKSDVRHVLELAGQQAETVILMPAGNVGNCPFFCASRQLADDAPLAHPAPHRA